METQNATSVPESTHFQGINKIVILRNTEAEYLRKCWRNSTGVLCGKMNK